MNTKKNAGAVSHKDLLIFLLLILISLVSGYFLSLLIWNPISLPLSNPYHAIGKLTMAKFNPLVNTIRWGLFVLMPSLIFFLLSYIPFVRRIISSVFIKFLPALTQTAAIKTVFNKLPLSHFTKISLFLLLIIPCLMFVQKDFSTANFDVFHEGEGITPAFNYIKGNGIWSGNLFVHGAFHDLFTAVLGWKIFGIVSIGAYRVMGELAKLLVPISLAFLLYAICASLKNKYLRALVIQAMLFFYLSSLSIQNFDRRDASLLLGVAILILALRYKSRALFFISGLFSALCTFYSLDMGIYFTLLLLFYPILTLILRMFKKVEVGSLTFGILSGWLMFYLLVGPYEFSSFISNFLYIFRVKDLLDSYVYPFPSLITSFRFAFPLMLQSLNFLVYLIFLFFVYLKNDLKTQGFVHSILTALSLIHYRSALGRSDLTHIEYSSSLVIMVLGLNLVLLLIFLKPSKKILDIIITSFFVLNCFFLIYPSVKGFNPINIVTFDKRLKDFIQKKDEEFINKDRTSGIVKLKEIFNEERCIYSLTSEALTPYLLKKPSCGPIYISYFASVDPYRESFLRDLMVNNPKYLVYSSKSWTQNLDNIINSQRFPKLMEYVNSNYSHYETVSDYWEVYRRNL